jgi:hypothetical protein
MTQLIYAAILAGYLLLSSGSSAMGTNNQSELTRTAAPEVTNELE